ncbi:MAG: hypothetical protein KKH98_00195 [Spirochaetes bacterium]|nr:hypothetical protein [Spirochaetota bacterium]
MKKLYFVLFITLLAIEFFKFNLFSNNFPGSEQLLSTDSKMMSLSASFDSVSDSIESVYYNPAGLVHVDDIMFSWSRPIWSIFFNIDYFSLVIDNRYIPFGIGLLNSRTEGIAIRNDTPEISRLSSVQDITIFLSGGYEFVKGLSTGLRLKFNYKDILGHTDTGLGADIAFLWRRENPSAFTKSGILKILQPFSFGIVFYNILPPDIKLNDSADKYPIIIRTSISYRFGKIFNFIEPETSLGFDTAPEYEFVNFNVGLELVLLEALYLRSGYKITEKDFTIGTGLKVWDIIIDFGMSSIPVKSNYYNLTFKVQF